MTRFVSIFLIVLLLLTSCEFLPIETTSQEVNFTLAPSAKHTIAVEVREGHWVQGSFSVSGKENFIDFYIKDPAGGLAYGVVRAQGGLSFEAQAETTGLYTLYFDNSFSFGSSRDITLRYQVR